jgi:hypothetical protein
LCEPACEAILIALIAPWRLKVLKQEKLMFDEVRELFKRWERVWHEHAYDLVPSCLGDHYIRHDENGDRTVTREAYTAELKTVHEARPGIRVVVYDHTFSENRAWFRFSFQWPDATTGEIQSRAGMQSYRIEAGSWLRPGSPCVHSVRPGRTRHKIAGPAPRVSSD